MLINNGLLIISSRNRCDESATSGEATETASGEAPDHITSDDIVEATISNKADEGECNCRLCFCFKNIVLNTILMLAYGISSDLKVWDRAVEKSRDFVEVYQHDFKI